MVPLKTTLIKKLLKEALNGQKVVLIENEFKHQLENNSEQQALQNIIELHDEETPDYIRNILAGYIKN